MEIIGGLNPYGLTYHLGLQGMGTRRHNPHGTGLDGFIRLGQELDAKVLELWEGWLAPLSDDDLALLRDRLDALSMARVVSSGLQHGDIDLCIRAAKVLKTQYIRMALTPILCGDRAVAPGGWQAMTASVRDKLGRYAGMAAEHGLTILIENHQDFTAEELVGYCEEFGPAVRIVLDTGNTFPVGQAPLEFTRTVAPWVRHVHLKDYNVQPTDEGFRLVRCAIGDGAAPLGEMLAILGGHHDQITAVLEPGALEVRHVRLFTPGWWRLYPQRSAESLAACLLATQRNPLARDADYRTPWEKGEDAVLEDYELAMIRRSAANMKTLGIF